MKRLIILTALTLSVSLLLSACSGSNPAEYDASRAKVALAGAKSSDISLLEGINTGNLEEVKRAVRDGASLDRLSGNLSERTDHNTPEKNPFRIACFSAHFNVAKYLIQAGADPDYMDAYGEPILAYAARMGDIQLCRLLLEHGANINKKSDKGYTALDSSFCGITASNVENDYSIEKTVTFLLDHGAEITPHTVDAALEGYSNDGYCKYNLVQSILKKSFAAKQESGLSEAYQAAILGDSDRVASLFKAGKIAKSDEQKVFFYTSAFGDTGTLQLLLDKGMRMDSCDADGNTLLAIAARSGNVSVLQYLTDRELSPEAENFDHYSPLELAVANGQNDTANFLLSKGAKIKSYEAMGTQDVLENAAGRGNLDMVRLLFADGYPKEGVGHAMWAAAAENQVEIIKYFLDSGTDPNIEFLEVTPLESACMSGGMQAVKYLVEHGADVNGGTKKGAPLCSARDAGDTDMINYLISRGADESVQ